MGNTREEAGVVLAQAYRKLLGYLSTATLATYDMSDYTAVPWISSQIIRRRHGSRFSAAAVRAVQGALLLQPTLLRRLLGVKPCVMSGALAFYALSLCAAYEYDGDGAHLEQARALLRRMAALRIGTAGDPAWGFPFPWPRDEIVPPDTPIAYTTALCGEAWLRFARLTGDAEALGWAQGACHALLGLFNLTPHPHGGVALSYTSLDHSSVINVSALAAAFLLHGHSEHDHTAAEQLARQLLRFVLDQQAPDGSWPYSPTDACIDNSHTAMVLRALAECCTELGPG